MDSQATLDVRDLPPARRHERFRDAFADLPPGGTLVLVNDHEPTPLFHELAAEVEAFDADGYDAERRGPDEFVARFPKRETGHGGRD